MLSCLGGLVCAVKNFLWFLRLGSVCVSSVVLVSVWCFGRCLLVFCGAFLHVLWCVLTYFVVRFDDGLHGVRGMLSWVRALRGREFLRKKAVFPFSLLLPLLCLGVAGGCVCDEVVTLCCRHHHVASGCVGVVVKLFLVTMTS